MPLACQSMGACPDPLDFEDNVLDEDFENVGQIF